MGRVAAFRPVKRTSHDRAGRRYSTPDGEFWSVTTILGSGGPAKPALIAWAANEERKYMTEAAADLYMDLPTGPKMSRPAYIETLRKRLSAEKAADKKKREAAEIGSAVHKMIECQLRRELGQVVPSDEEPYLNDAAAFAFSQWQVWKDLVKLEPLWLEFTVWSKVFGYAGTLDLANYLTIPTDRELVKQAFRCPSDLSLEAFYQKFQGQRVFAVSDFKVTKNVYIEALFQVPAYAHAYQEMGHGIADLGIILRLPKEPGDKFEAVPILDLDYYFRGFTHILEIFKFVREYEVAKGYVPAELGA